MTPQPEERFHHDAGGFRLARFFQPRAPDIEGVVVQETRRRIYRGTVRIAAAIFVFAQTKGRDDAICEEEILRRGGQRANLAPRPIGRRHPGFADRGRFVDPLVRQCVEPGKRIFSTEAVDRRRSRIDVLSLIIADVVFVVGARRRHARAILQINPRMIVDDRIAIAEGRRVDAARLAVGRKFLLADPSQPAGVLAGVS